MTEFASPTNGRTASIAQVKLACSLAAQELDALRGAIERYAGRAVEMQVEIDPSILGGVWLQIGDMVLDGSVRGRLEALRQHLSSQARAVLSSGINSAEHEYRT